MIQEFTRKLKEHLYPRVCQKIKVAPSEHESGSTNDVEVSQNTILIKDNRIYCHKLARFYHTTYDVRRSEDIINPKTQHSNIMLLAENNSMDHSCSDPSSTTTWHPFIYARVLGIYHVNVVYVGPGMSGYAPLRFDFLHVRWFQHDGPGAVTAKSGPSSDWTSLRLDRLSFPPMARPDSFGFVDPSLVLRACHIIPVFDSGKRYADGIGLSTMAGDRNDWTNYYVNRFDTTQKVSLPDSLKEP